MTSGSAVDGSTGSAAPVINGARHLHSGKIRDLYERDDGRLLMVASDRVSAYDHVLSPTIPDKGSILTRMSLWWFDQLPELVPNHVVSTDVPPEVEGRALVCERLAMFPVECVARGYLAGSGYSDYKSTGAICGNDLPGGLVEGSRLLEPVFTPATKAALGGHDENVSYDAVTETVGDDAAAELRALTMTVYGRAESMVRSRGFLLADTKLEFGRRPDGVVVLADEVLTPDSSRFWPADQWQPGRAQPSYDKQLIRNWLTSAQAKWDRASDAAPPSLPPEVVERTRDAYIEVFERVTGEPF
ncbi:MAG: phosphoribosylaminoimidazolesuccinocarboxamide synthase [Nocardioidaceae bacterium]